MVRILILLLFLATKFQAQTTMITPQNLQKGDTIAIVATARKNITDNLKPALALAKSWGLEVVLGATIGLDDNQLAGTDEQRAADFQSMMDNPNIKAIWCVRGGYGTARMVELVDFSRFKTNPKWIVGFSDVTVLHSHLNTLGIASIHGIMPVNVEKASAEVEETLRKALFGETLSYSVACENENKLGVAEGELVGGNLSILYSMMGSESQVNCRGKILFIEDLDEYLYHIDRMMYNLKRNGYFENVKGIIVGSMADMHDNEIPFGQNEVQIITEIAKENRIPIAFQFPAGHQKDNRTLILGQQVAFEVNEKEVKLQFI